MKSKKLTTLLLTALCSLMLLSAFMLPASAATSIAKASVKYTAAYTYTGGAIKPAVTITVGGKTLTASQYSVSYKNNKNVGTATMTITGKGGYTGSLTRYFYITPKKVTGVKASTTDSKVTLSWSAVPGATGYQVYLYTAEGWKRLGNTANTKCTLSGYSAATAYKFRVRAYAKNAAAKHDSYKYLYSPFSDTCTAITTLKKPATVKASSIAYNSAKLSWSAVSKASGYQLWLYDTDAGKWVCKYQGTANSYTLTGLSPAKTYSVRARGFVKVSGKWIYSPVNEYTFKTAPAQIKTFTAEATGPDTVKLVWSSAGSVSGYQIKMAEVYDDGTYGAYEKIDNFSSSERSTVVSVAGGAKYRFRITAYIYYNGEYIFSPWKYSVIVTTPLPKVENFRAGSVTNTSASLSWNIASGVSGYKLYSGSTLIATLSRTQNTYVVKNLDEETRYTFSIQTYKGTDTGEKNTITVTTDNSNVDSVTFTKSVSSLSLGQTATVTATVSPSYAADKSITYSSSNPLIAKIDDAGVITTVYPGKTVITARNESSGKSASFTLTVKDKATTGFDLPETIYVFTGKPCTLYPEFIPAGNADRGFTVSVQNYVQSGKTYTYTDYLTITKSGSVTPKKVTKTNAFLGIGSEPFAFNITFTASDSGVTATTKIQVIDGDNVPKTFSLVDKSQGAAWYFGNSSRLSVDLTTNNYFNMGQLSWKSTRPEIATVDRDGNIKCVGVGSTDIIAYSPGGGLSTRLTINTRASIKIAKNYFYDCKIGETYYIDAQVQPAGASAKIVYSALDSSIASVENKDTGAVRFNGNGAARVIVSLENQPLETYEVWFDSLRTDAPSGTKSQLYAIMRTYANSIKSGVNLPGFTRTDASYFDNFSVKDKSSSAIKAFTAEDLKAMFMDFAAPQSVTVFPVYVGDDNYNKKWEEYLSYIPIKGQTQTILDGLDLNKSVKSVEVIDDGGYTFDMKLTLNSEYFSSLPTSPAGTAHGKVFDILTNSYIASILDSINNSGSGMKMTYGSFTQNYHDSSMTITVNKLTDRVTAIHYDMNIKVNVTDYSLKASLISYTADVGFDCNNVISINFK
ncbi:MAG: fibronectin type III domain-containing protein [Oscillospiraceae bacterium]|nr:fibronectin type III domain-containing protein [Oscillospiraceae bacterium]